MKATLLFTMLSMLFAVPEASAATELETLRARCAEQEQLIQSLKEEVQNLKTPHPRAATAKKPSISSAQAATTYMVRPGDSIERIARKNHCSPASLAKLNGFKPSSMIHPGQKLKIPGTAATPPSEAASAASAAPSAMAGKTHQIREGETYSSISRKYGIAVQTLIDANPKAKATALRPGQTILLAPAISAPAPAAPQLGEVKSLFSSTPKAKTPPAAPKPASPASRPAPTPHPVRPPVEPVEIVETAPAVAAPKEAPTPAPKKKIHSVTIEGEMTYAEFAAKHGTDIKRLNDLNGLDLTNATVLAKGSELYVPAQP